MRLSTAATAFVSPVVVSSQADVLLGKIARLPARFKIMAVRKVLR